MVDDIFLPPDGSSVLPTLANVLAPAPAVETTAYYGQEPQTALIMDGDTPIGIDLVTDEAGHVVMATGAQALAASIAKQLNTGRNQWLAYGPNYGNDAGTAMADLPIGTTLQDVALTCVMEVIQGDARVDASEEIDVGTITPIAQDDDGNDIQWVVAYSGAILDVFGETTEVDTSFVTSTP